MARDYLALLAASASTERIFSYAADVCTTQRASLSVSTMEKSVSSGQWLKEGVIPEAPWSEVVAYRNLKVAEQEAKQGKLDRQVLDGGVKMKGVDKGRI
jgi:hypothetical protein